MLSHGDARKYVYTNKIVYPQPQEFMVEIKAGRQCKEVKRLPLGWKKLQTRKKKLRAEKKKTQPQPRSLESLKCHAATMPNIEMA